MKKLTAFGTEIQGLVVFCYALQVHNLYVGLAVGLGFLLCVRVIAIKLPDFLVTDTEETLPNRLAKSCRWILFLVLFASIGISAAEHCIPTKEGVQICSRIFF